MTRELCEHPVRGMGSATCTLDKGHRGYHSCVTYTCDGCGKRRRGQPHQTDPDVGGFCFMCSGPPAQDRYGSWY